MTTNIESMIAEIASFYNNPDEALRIMEKYNIIAGGEAYLKHFLQREKGMFLKRVSQGVKKLADVEFLASRLDDTRPVQHMCGHSLRFPAYEAELYYQGSMRFWYE